MDLAVVDLEHLPGRQLVRAGAAFVPRQAHDHDPRTLVDHDVAHRDPAQTLEDLQGLLADVVAAGREGASRAGHQVAVLEAIGVLGEGGPDRIERLGPAEAARVIHGDLDGLVPRGELFRSGDDVHRLGRRARVSVDVEDQTVRAAAGRDEFELAELLVGVDLGPHHQEHRRARFLDHHARDGLARALVEDVLTIAAQLGDRTHQADLVQGLFHGVLGDAQCGGDGQLADVMFDQGVDHLGDLAAQALAVAGRRRAGGRQGRLRGECGGRPKDQTQHKDAFHGSPPPAHEAPAQVRAPGPQREAWRAIMARPPRVALGAMAWA